MHHPLVTMYELMQKGEDIPVLSPYPHHLLLARDYPIDP